MLAVTKAGREWIPNVRRMLRSSTLTDAVLAEVAAASAIGVRIDPHEMRAELARLCLELLTCAEAPAEWVIAASRLLGSWSNRGLRGSA